MGFQVIVHEEVAKPEEYRRDLQKFVAGSPLNYLA